MLLHTVQLCQLYPWLSHALIGLTLLPREATDELSSLEADPPLGGNP